MELGTLKHLIGYSGDRESAKETLVIIQRGRDTKVGILEGE